MLRKLKAALALLITLFGLQALDLGIVPRLVNGQAVALAQAETSPLGALLAQAQALITQRKSAQAFSLLKDKEDSYAGSVDYDYLLGIAANDSKQYGQAILALERVLLVKPDYLQARAELAKAYALAKEPSNAKAEFETLSAQPLPADVKRTIAQYLNALKVSEKDSALKSAGSTKQTASFETFLGIDSNVNFGTALDEWILKGGLTVVPQDSSKPKKSAVFGANIASNWVIPISGDLELTAGGQLGMRSQPSAHTLDPVNAELFAGVTKTVSQHLLSSGIQYQHLRLDGNPFRDALGIFAQWQSPSNGSTQFGAYLQQHQFTYANQSVRNAHRSTIGLTAAALTGEKNTVALVASLYGGVERSNSSADYLSFNFLGARAAATKHFSASFRASLASSYEKRNFKAVETNLFSDVRVDNQLDFRAAMDYDLSKDWQISPQVIFTRNRSTLGPNDYQRTQALLFARFRF
jgi:outer membrane protein